MNFDDDLVPQREDAGRSDSRGQGRRRGGGGVYAVAPLPVSGNAGFTFARARAVQCRDDMVYTVSSDCAERDYFTEPALDAVLKAVRVADASSSTMSSKMLTALGDAIEQGGVSPVRLSTVQYGQLKRIATPNISAREPPMNDLDWKPEHYYTPYVVRHATSKAPKSTHYVQAPVSEGGRHYELTNIRAWPWSVVLVFHVELDDFDEDRYGVDAEGTVDHAVEIRMSYRTAAHDYGGAHTNAPREQCVKVSVGEFNAATRAFRPWTDDLVGGAVLISDCDTVKSLFYNMNWPSPPRVDNSVNGDDAVHQEPDVAESSLQFEFSVCDDALCVLTTRGDSTTTATKIANFYVVRILDVFQATDGAHAPWMRLLCRRLLDASGSGTVYLSAGDENRAPDTGTAKYLDVEVHVEASKIKHHADVRTLFMSAHPNLVTTMSSQQFNCYAGLHLEQPATTACVAYVGRQSNDVFVAGNCCYADGNFLTHAESGFDIVPEFFADNLTPLRRADFPQHVLIPFPHVRFIVGTHIWNAVMPAFFKNNLQPARATFAMAVMGLHASKVWSGQSGLGHGMPFAWVYSNEPNTGKTEASLLCQAVSGFFKRALWAGDTTKPALFERFSQQRDISVIVDDVVVHDNSRTYAQLGRAIYDKSTRAVSGKIREPRSSAIFTVRTPRGARTAAPGARAPTRPNAPPSRRTRHTRRTRDPRAPRSRSPPRTPPRTAHPPTPATQPTPGPASARALPRRRLANAAVLRCRERPAPPRSGRAPRSAGACGRRIHSVCTPSAARAHPSDRCPCPARTRCSA